MNIEEFKEKYSIEQRLSPLRKEYFNKAKIDVAYAMHKFIGAMNTSEGNYHMDDEIKELLIEKLVTPIIKEESEEILEENDNEKQDESLF